MATQIVSSVSQTHSTVSVSLPRKVADKDVLSIAVEETPQHYDLNGDRFEVPTFTMKQIYDAIPSHCFQPVNVRSMSYVLRDLALSAMLIYSATYIHLIPSPVLRGLAWTAYTVAQGMVWTGIWILGHECGHGALFTHRWLNHLVGMILHSFLLMPFHSWRISHSKHHKATGHMSRDMVFIPETKEQYLTRKFGKDFDLDSTLDDAHAHAEHMHLLEDTPLYSLYKVLEHQLVGMPGYLLFSFSAPYKRDRWWTLSHFYFGNGSPIFKPQDARDVIISDLGIVAILGAIYASVQLLGAWNTFIGYIVPYLMVNHWIVAITYLHHTDGSVPHYTEGTWSFARGAAATIDRDFGFIGRHLFHDIIETHVLHHLVSTIPFYHAEEASAAIKGILGNAYHSDTRTNLLVALWRNFRRCQWVEETAKGSGVYMFRNVESEVKKRKAL